MQFRICDSRGRHSEAKDNMWVRHEKAKNLRGIQKEGDSFCVGVCCIILQPQI